ncbi:AMP-binding protein, partial [Streptomyces massasporeus]
MTIWNSVPAPMRMWIDALGDGAVPRGCRLRLALLSGDWIPVDLPARIREKLPAMRVISLGGATEGSIWSIHHPVENVRPEWSSIPYGKPLANQTMHVLNQWQEPSPVGVTGEIHIGGVALVRPQGARGVAADEVSLAVEAQVARTHDGVVRLPTAADPGAGGERRGGAARALVRPEDARGVAGYEVGLAVAGQVALARDLGVGVPAATDPLARRERPVHVPRALVPPQHTVLVPRVDGAALPRRRRPGDEVEAERAPGHARARAVPQFDPGVQVAQDGRGPVGVQGDGVGEGLGGRHLGKVEGGMGGRIIQDGRGVGHVPRTLPVRDAVDRAHGADHVLAHRRTAR